MKKILFIVALFSSFLIFSCDDINSMHDKYLQNGEDLHVGKLDSFYIYSGKERAALKFWVGDYRATKLLVKRGDNDQEQWFDLPASNRKDSIVVYINNLLEGSNQLTFITSNEDKTVFSIPINQTITTYGAKFQAVISQRGMKKITVDVGGLVNLTWGSRTSAQLIGQELFYKLASGKDTTLIAPATDAVTKLANMNLTGSITYRSLYTPTVASIDTFYTDKVTIAYPFN
jgi:hypothetical protein